MNEDKQTKMDDSMMFGSGNKYQPYSLGRKRMLRKLGNPFFGGDGNPEEWDLARKMGTAWVVFTTPYEELKSIMAMQNPLEFIDAKWEGEMHAKEEGKIYEWIIQEEGIVDEVRTEPVSMGKPEAEPVGTQQAG